MELTIQAMAIVNRSRRRFINKRSHNRFKSNYDFPDIRFHTDAVESTHDFASPGGHNTSFNRHDGTSSQKKNELVLQGERRDAKNIVLDQNLIARRTTSGVHRGAKRCFAVDARTILAPALPRSVVTHHC